MSTKYGRQEYSDEMTPPLKTLLELYASHSERLGNLSSQMANIISLLERLSRHIGERLNEARVDPGRVHAANVCARPKSVTPSGEDVHGEPMPENRGSTESLRGVVYPERVYGAPYPPRGSIAASVSLPDADIHQAKCGSLVLTVGNGYAGYSADGGNTLVALNPTAMFPPIGGGGQCYSQVAQYLPGIDRFVWLIQFNAGTNDPNLLRIAAASPQEIICTKCTGWTYWDLRASHPRFNKGMNHPDISVSHNVLSVIIGQRETELFLVEIPIKAIRAGGPIHWRSTTRSTSAPSRGDRLHSVTGQDQWQVNIAQKLPCEVHSR
jgi:hypothetical protein